MTNNYDGSMLNLDSEVSNLRQILGSKVGSGSACAPASPTQSVRCSHHLANASRQEAAERCSQKYQVCVTASLLGSDAITCIVIALCIVSHEEGHFSLVYTVWNWECALAFVSVGTKQYEPSLHFPRASVWLKKTASTIALEFSELEKNMVKAVIIRLW